MHNIISSFSSINSTVKRLFLAYLLNIYDMICTNIWVQRYGLDIEGNPFGRWLYSNNMVFIVKVVFIGLSILLIHHLLKKAPKLSWVSWLILLVYGGLAIYHTVIGVTLLSI